MLFNEPKLLKSANRTRRAQTARVSVLFNEPKLLKSTRQNQDSHWSLCFSALQRAEIAEMRARRMPSVTRHDVSVLFNEPKLLKSTERAEPARRFPVSVLFNEPKLLKSSRPLRLPTICPVSVLFNEPKLLKSLRRFWPMRRSCMFQCSSTSRNC